MAEQSRQEKQKVPARCCATTDQRAIPDNTDLRQPVEGDQIWKHDKQSFYCGACGGVLSRHSYRVSVR